MKMVAVMMLVVAASSVSGQHRPTEQSPGSEPGSHRGARSISVLKGERPILSYLRPDDTELLVDDGITRVSSAPLPPGETAIGLATKAAELIATIRVTRTNTQLSSRKDWVDTVVVGEVIDLLKNTTRHALASGATMTFVSPDGVLPVGKQRVHAFSIGSHPFLPGHTYIVFATDSGGYLQTSSKDAFRLEGESAVPMLSDHRGGAVEIGPMRADDLLQEVIVWAKAGQH